MRLCFASKSEWMLQASHPLSLSLSFHAGLGMALPPYTHSPPRKWSSHKGSIVAEERI